MSSVYMEDALTDADITYCTEFFHFLIKISHI